MRVCKLCHHLMPDEANHKCPDTEYLKVVATLVLAAAIADETIDHDELERSCHHDDVDE